MSKEWRSKLGSLQIPGCNVMCSVVMRMWCNTTVILILKYMSGAENVIYDPSTIGYATLCANVKLLHIPHRPHPVTFLWCHHTSHILNQLCPSSLLRHTQSFILSSFACCTISQFHRKLISKPQVFIQYKNHNFLAYCICLWITLEQQIPEYLQKLGHKNLGD